MKKAFTLFAAVMMLASIGFAQKGNTAKGTDRTIVKSERFIPAKLARNASLKNGRKIAGNPVWNDTMSYCLNGTYNTSVGTGSTGTNIYWGIQIESAALTGRNNLTDVEFFVAYAGNYTLNIYSGAQPTGTAVYTQVITATNADTMTWKNIHFTTPLAITQSQNLWIILSNSDLAYPASAVNPNTYDNGKWISIDGTQWMSVADAGVDATWMIRAISDTYTELPPIVDITGPVSVRTGDTATFTATSSNATSYTWTINADYTNMSGNVATAMWTTAGTYDVIVTATNNVGSTDDTLSVEVFDCSGITFPYTPNFDGGLGCWTTRSDSTDETGWFASVDMFDSNPEGQVLSISAQNYGFFVLDLPVDNWLFSPTLTMPATGEYEIAWQVMPFDPSLDGDHYGVYVISGTDTTLLFEESLIGMSDYNQRVAVIPGIVSGNFQVAFRHFNSEGGYVIILDSIQIRTLSAPQVALRGPVAVENGVAASFTAVCGNATSFSWTVDGNTVSATGNTLTHTFTTDGNHTIGVTASNSVNSATASMTVEVYSCEAITTFPYSQGFETGSRCWTMVSADPTNDDKFGVFEDENAYDGDFDFRFSSYNRATDYNQYLISPELTLPTGEYMVKFQYMGASPNESFRVLASTTTTDITAFTNVLGDITSTEEDWTEVAFLLPAGTKYIAIDYYGDYVYYLFIDNISIEALAAPTVTLTGDTRIELNTSGTFTANSPLATSFSWTVDGVDVNVTGNTLTHTFTTLGNHTVAVTVSNNAGSNSASMTVDVYECDHINTFPYVQDFESPNDFTCWKFVDADGDGYNWSTDYLRDFVNESGMPEPQGHNGSNGMAGSASWSQMPLNPDNWMILPTIDLPASGSYILSWYEKGQDNEYFAEHYSVYVSTTGKNISDFTTPAYTGTTTNNWIGRNINLAAYAGQTIYVAFRHHDITDMFYLDIDDIKIATEGVGIDEVNNSALNLYPNPASTTVAVSAEGIEGNVTVQVVDLNGRVMMQQQGNAQSFRFDVSTLAQGAYFVRMTGENVNAVRKLIVK